MKYFKVGFVQNYPKFLRVGENIAQALELMNGHSADLWVLPEFFATGYNFKNKKEVAQVAEKVPEGLTCRKLLNFSLKKSCAVVAGLPEKKGGIFFNSAVLIHNRKVFLYRKTHLFGNEKTFFKPGNTGFSVQNIGGVKVGIMICFDWFFPESARTLVLMGAELIAHPSNLVLPWGPKGMKIRSLENRVFSVTANRIGKERGLKFIGQSQIVNPAGEILARASNTQVQVCIAEINAHLAKDKKLTPQNHILKDRRTQFYRR